MNLEQPPLEKKSRMEEILGVAEELFGYNEEQKEAFVADQRKKLKEEALGLYRALDKYKDNSENFSGFGEDDKKTINAMREKLNDLKYDLGPEFPSEEEIQNMRN